MNEPRDAGGRVGAAAERLSDARPGVRRVAVLDLIACARADDNDAAAAANAALLAALPAETDVRAALLMIDHFRREAWAPALPALLALYERPETDVEIAIEAARAHDEVAARQRDGG